MSEDRGSGPIIFTGLYAACILLTIAAVMMHDRFGEMPFRNWAPFLQAILSAGAIFAAFAIQERKRQADLMDARLALRETYVAKSRSMEHFISFLYERAVANNLTPSILKRQAQHFNDDIDDIRSLSLEKLRAGREIATANLFAATCRQLQARMEDQAEREKNKSYIDATQLKYWVGQVMRRRQRMLTAFGVSSEPDRLERLPEARRLMQAELEQDALDERARMEKALKSEQPAAPAR